MARPPTSVLLLGLAGAILPAAAIGQGPSDNDELKVAVHDVMEHEQWLGSKILRLTIPKSEEGRPLMITILGAGGGIGSELAKVLIDRKQRFRLVGRSPSTMAGATEIVSADITDQSQTIRAVAGSKIVHLLVGLKYDHKVWAEMWPRVMANAIEACKRAKAKLVFFDNVYMYGRVHGPMVEGTPFSPCSKKGETRARIANLLIQEWRSGALTAMIARSADFYGPLTRNSVPNLLVMEPLSKARKASWLVNDSAPHSFTYIPDAARSLVMLAETEIAWNQTWHLPTAPNPPTGTEFINMAAKEFGVAPKHRVLTRPMIRLAGLFDSNIRESYEMLYQSDSAYLFDSSKFAEAYGFSGTPYQDGISTTATSFKKRAG